jgi:hypothetical protein
MEAGVVHVTWPKLSIELPDFTSSQLHSIRCLGVLLRAYFVKQPLPIICFERMTLT